MRTQRFADAEAAAGEILSQAPEHAEANHIIGVLHLRSRRVLQAVAALQKAVHGDPGNVGAQTNLGTALTAAGNYREAGEAFQQVLRLDPRQPDAHAGLAQIEMRRNNPPEALRLYQQALAIQPHNSLLHANIAHAYSASGAVEEAIVHYKKALSRNPNFTEARYGLAQALRDIGEIGAALEHYEAVMRLDPNHASAMLSFAMIADSVNDKQQARIRNSCRDAVPDSDQYMLLNFALGRIEELNKDYATAFYHFQEGNRVRDRQTGYSIAATRGEFQRIISTFDRQFFEERAEYGYRDASPIFIVGMPRSGTTLVEQILASHSSVTGAGELAFLPGAVFSALGGIGANGFPNAAPLLTRQDIGKMARDYLANAHAGLGESQVHTDKLPGNFIFIGMIHLMFPNARIIHCTREPRDTCMSLYKTFFPSGGHHFSYNLDNLRDYYCLYSRLMEHWNGLLKDSVIEVNYEALVSNPELGIRSLLNRTGLPFEPKCLEFNKTRRVVRTASASQVRKPMYTSSIGTWRRYRPYIPILRETA